jgi:hypothetical protein
MLGNAYGTLLKVQAPTVDYSLSRVEFRKQIRKGNDAFGKKYGLKTSLSENKSENLSKIGIALDKEHEEKYKIINKTPEVIKGKIKEADQEIFNDAVEAGYQEFKYQLGLGKKKTSISGSGWYDKTITDTIEKVKKILPQMNEGTAEQQLDKELQFKLFLALFSPQGGPEINLDVAVQVYKTYLETGVVPEEKSLFVESPKFGISHQSMLSSLKLVDYLVKKSRNYSFRDYLFTAQTYKELGKEKLDSGFFEPAKTSKKLNPSQLKSFLKNNSDYSVVRWTKNEIKKGKDGAGNKVPKGANTNTIKTYTNKKTGEITNQVNKELNYADLSDVNKEVFNQATGKKEEAQLFPAFMFGEKVGTFFLNFNGYEGVTKDRWFSRHYYRQFGQVGIARDPKTGKPRKFETKMVKDMSGKMVKRTYPPGHDPTTKLRDTPQANDRKVMELYVEGIKQKAITNGDLKGKDATRQNVQAILWYFEQGLYTDLGLESIPIDYIQASKALENKIKNDKKTGGLSYGQFYSKTNRSINEIDDETSTLRKEEKETRARKEEKELSVSENLQDVIPTELSVSKPKLEGDFSFDFVDKDNFNASDPQFEDFTSLKDFYDKVIGDVDTLEGEFETQGIGSQLKTDDYGDGTGRFYVNIIMDGDNVGYIHGENTDQDIAYVHYARVFGDSLPNQVWKNLAKEFKRKFGTKRFAGYRITGARRLSEKKQREVEEKLLGGATYVSPLAISPEFSLSNVESFYKDPINYSEYSLSNNTPQNDNVFREAKVTSETDNRVGLIGSDVSELLFENRKLKEGTPVAVRLNLNTTIFYDENTSKIKELKNKFANIKNEEGFKLAGKEFGKYRNKRKKEIAIETGVSILTLQTAHDKNTDGNALGYDKAITVKDPTFDVNQKKRFQVIEKREKTPMASVKGGIVQKKIDKPIEGKRIFFNPFQHHLFIDESGNAVKSVKGEVTVFNSAAYTNGEIEYYSREQGETLEVETENNKSKVSYKFETEKEKSDFELPEMDTLSKEKLVEYNLEFSTSPNDFNEGSDLKDFFSRINPPRQRRTIAGHWKNFTDYTRANFYQGAVDQYSSVKKYIGEEPYKAMTMTYSSAGATESALLYGVPFLDKDGAIDLKEGTAGTGLFTRFEKLGKDLPDFLAWVAAKRAEKIYESGKETGLGSIESIRAGTKLNKGREKKFNEALRDLNVFNEAFLKIGRDSGYLSQQAYNEWTSDGGYNFYVPFYRLLEDKDSNSGPKAAEGIVNQPEYQSYKGANIPVQDLLSNVIRNYNFLTEASLKNLAGRKALEQGSKIGVAREVSFGEKSKDAVFVRKNGKQVFYEVENDLVLKSLHALNWGGYQNFAMSTLRKFKRWLTYGVTASPAFRIRNLIRDTMHSIAVGKLSYNPLGNVLDGYKGMSGGEKSELRAKMGFGGGEIHFGHIYGNDPNATQMLLDRAVDLNTVMQSDGWTAAGRKALNKGFGKAVLGWNELGSFAENINRAALYKQLKDKGVSHFEASYQARDLLNFSRHGASPIIRILTQSVPFLNARIQGLDKAGRAFFSGQRTQLLTTLGAYSLASVALYLMFKDDEDFKDREQWDRDTYHWFKLPGSETAFRIPRPFEVGAVGVMFERMMEQMVDDDVHGELLRERALHVILETFSFDVRPQLITPMLEVYANKDTFTKRPIESAWMENLPASERKYAYTSSAYVNTAKILEKVSWNQIKFSPVQMEHLVEGYFGWMGASIAQVISFKDYPRKFTEFTSAESPLFMGFVKSTPSMRTKYNTQFYDAMKEMNEVNSLMNMYMKNGDTDKAMKIYNKNKNLLAWRSTYVKTNTQITKINRQIKLIQSQKNLSERERYNKVKQLKLLKQQIVRTLSENVLAYEKANNTKVKRPLWWN